MIKYDEVWDKYDGIWDAIKNKVNIKFHSEPVYEYQYLKAKVREFNGVIKTFWIMVCQKKLYIILALLV